MKIRAVFILALTLCLGAIALASSGGPSLPADEALKLLKDGNARYVAGNATHPNQGPERRAETVKNGQHPVATIIGCSDSREPLEIIFDQGVGDLFVIRVAGNVAGTDEIASVEYAVGHLGTPVVLVLGHSSCGAVTAAVQNAKVGGSLPALLSQIKPAVARARAWSPTAGGGEFLDKAIRANVWQTMETLLRKSHEVREFVKQGRILLVGGVYDLTSGQVAWLGQHPEQGRIIAAADHPVVRKPKPKPKAEEKDAAKAEPEGKDAGAVEAKAAPKAEEKPAAKPAPKAAPKAAAKHESSGGEGGSILPPPEKEDAPAKGAHK